MIESGFGKRYTISLLLTKIITSKNKQTTTTLKTRSTTAVDLRPLKDKE